MEMFTDLKNKIFHSAATEDRPPYAAGFVRPANTATAVAAPVDVAAILTKLTAESKEPLDWKVSIVDLLKLLGMDRSLDARMALAAELHYTGDTKDSASMNIWLHKEVMRKLADNGGKVPAELLAR